MKTTPELLNELHLNLSNIADTNIQSYDLNPNLLPKEKWVQIFESMLSARTLDFYSRINSKKGLSFYTIGSSGHEILALWGEITRINDIALLHYRDAAFYIQRASKYPGSTTLFDLLCSFAVSKHDQISSGRHKVLGNAKLNIPPQTSTISSHLPKAVGLALSITKTRDLKITSHLPPNSIVTCSFGDASLNHASAQTAINAADYLSYTNIPLPLIFVCEDNGIGISKKTADNWVENFARHKKNIKYINIQLNDFNSAVEKMREALKIATIFKRPVFLHIKTVRLYGHAGNDIETKYRSENEIEEGMQHDPILVMAKSLIRSNFLNTEELVSIFTEIEKRILAISEVISHHNKLRGAKEIMSSLVPQRQNETVNAHQIQHNNTHRCQDKKIKSDNLSKMLNSVLREQMYLYPQICLIGLDIGKKGGVYNVTNELIKDFGAKRVIDSILDETMILGTSIGMSMNGILPISEIQFLAYYHNAQDQIRGEAATLSYFSNGQYQNGMIVRIPGLAYQQGLGGHFHNDNSISALRDVPSLIVACASNGRSAVKIIRSLVKLAIEGRVCILIEPIALYFTKDLMVENDKQWMTEYPHDLDDALELGEFETYLNENSVNTLLVTYGNGTYLSMQAREILREKNILIDIIDLCWLTNYNKQRLISVVKKYKNVLIVDECRRQGSLSEELITLFHENDCNGITISRLTGHDCFIPLGPISNDVLITKEDIVNKVILITDSQQRNNG